MNPETKTILVVDDEPLNLKMIAAHLKPKGYRVLEAMDGQEALKKAEEKPDLILLDFMMPGISGLETCRRLKASQDTKDIPVIFLSALDDLKKMLSDFEMSDVDYLSKPFDPKDLVRVAARVDEAYLVLWDNFEGSPDQFAAYARLDRARLALLQGRFGTAQTHLEVFDTLLDFDHELHE